MELVVGGISPSFSPADRYKGCRNLSDATLSSKQIELGRGIPRVLNFEPNSKIIEVAANSRGNGRDMRTSTDNKKI